LLSGPILYERLRQEKVLFTFAGSIVGLVLPVEVPWMLYTAALALIGSLLGALYQHWKAAQKDPIDALTYE
jgi:predicted benzoate:H+ symporter BenE